MKKKMDFLIFSPFMIFGPFFSFFFQAVLRRGDCSSNKPDGAQPAVTDNGNYIIDLHFTHNIKDVVQAAQALKNTGIQKY